jgi:hypothetical protein
MPAWFLAAQGFADAPSLWAKLHNGLAEQWLSTSPPPFFGRPRTKKTPGVEYFRKTEVDTGAVGGISAKSVFQTGGGGAVGTGSLRGMCTLHILREAGFAVWPFDAPAHATLVEIYPRVLTGTVVKSNAMKCAQHLARYTSLGAELHRVAASCEDAFDAAVSALEMAAHQDELATLERASDPRTLIEGAIWRPSCARAKCRICRPASAVST